MAACIVVADDLTGANATGVLLTKMQYRAATIMSLDNNDPEEMQECDCLLYPTIWEVRPTPCWTVWEKIISQWPLPAFLLQGESSSAITCW